MKEINLNVFEEANWPSCDGRSSETTKKHHEWLRSISSTIVVLLKKVEKLEIENKQLSETIRAANANKMTSSTKISSRTLADIVTGNKKSERSEEEIVSVLEISREMDDRVKTAMNVVISGIEESKDQLSSSRSEHDKKIVTDMLSELGVNKNKMKRVSRIKRNDKDVNAKPNMILVELEDVVSRQTVLANSKKLAHSEKFNRVYVNPDRTYAERLLDRKLRELRNERNNKLEHIEIINDMEFKYRKDKDGKRWYWGIRNDRLVELLHKDDWQVQT